MLHKYGSHLFGLTPNCLQGYVQGVQLHLRVGQNSHMMCAHVCLLSVHVYVVHVHGCGVHGCGVCVCYCVWCVCVYTCTPLTVSVEVISNHPITPGKVSFVAKVALSIHMLC